MKDIYLIDPKLFNVGYIILFDEEFIKSMEPLINKEVAEDFDSLLKKIDKLLETDNSSLAQRLGYVAGLIRENLGEKIEQFLFIDRAKRDKMVDIVAPYNIGMLNNYISDAHRKIVDEELVPILETKKLWLKTIPSRKKTDFEAFIIQCRRLETNHIVFMGNHGNSPINDEGGKLIDLMGNHKLVDTIADNSKIFYDARVETTNTGLAVLVNKRQLLEIIKHGIDYQTKMTKAGMANRIYELRRTLNYGE